MKRSLSIIIGMMMFALQVVAEDSKEDSSSQGIKLEIAQYNNHDGKVHRAPMRVDIEAWYSANSNSINISYDGEAEGEVFLYLNGDIMDHSPEINTKIIIPPMSGLYQIEIVGEGWIAHGHIDL